MGSAACPHPPILLNLCTDARLPAPSSLPAGAARKCLKTCGLSWGAQRRGRVASWPGGGPLSAAPPSSTAPPLLTAGSRAPFAQRPAPAAGPRSPRQQAPRHRSAAATVTAGQQALLERSAAATLTAGPRSPRQQAPCQCTAASKTAGPRSPRQQAPPPPMPQLPAARPAARPSPGHQAPPQSTPPASFRPALSQRPLAPSAAPALPPRSTSTNGPGYSRLPAPPPALPPAPPASLAPTRCPCVAAAAAAAVSRVLALTSSHQTPLPAWRAVPAWTAAPPTLPLHAPRSLPLWPAPLLCRAAPRFQRPCEPCPAAPLCLPVLRSCPPNAAAPYLRLAPQYSCTHVPALPEQRNSCLHHRCDVPASSSLVTLRPRGVKVPHRFPVQRSHPVDRVAGQAGEQRAALQQAQPLQQEGGVAWRGTMRPAHQTCPRLVSFAA